MASHTTGRAFENTPSGARTAIEEMILNLSVRGQEERKRTFLANNLLVFNEFLISYLISRYYIFFWRLFVRFVEGNLIYKNSHNKTKYSIKIFSVIIASFLFVILCQLALVLLVLFSSF